MKHADHNILDTISNLPSCVEPHVSLKDKNWFKTGGQARYFASPRSIDELVESVSYAKRYAMPVYILGSGANVLISDEGFDGMVIRPSNTTMSIVQRDDHRVLVQAGAGVQVADLIDFCLNEGCIGLEEFSGIPGSVGGSVYINLHYFEFLFAQYIVSAQVLNLDTLSIETVDVSWFQFGYNTSRLHEKKHLLLTATFCLKPADTHAVAYAKGRQKEIIRHRQQRYPRSHTCGSFFRNFLPHEVSLESNGKKMIYVAYYLDKIGVKGQLSVGGAIVSYQHANMIVNQGNATSADIIDLARLMQEMVLANFGIVPQPECQLIGFKTYPFLK